MSHPDLDPDAQARLVAFWSRPRRTPRSPARRPARSSPPRPRSRSRHAAGSGSCATPPARSPTPRSTVSPPSWPHGSGTRCAPSTTSSPPRSSSCAPSARRCSTRLDGLNAFGAGGAVGRLDALEVNGELMKAELAAFRDQPRRAGPGHRARRRPRRGAGAVLRAPRALDALDRRVRAAVPSAPAPAPSTADAPAPAAAASDASGGFDYVGFERRFRGDSDTVLATLADRYGPLLADHQPVLDFGCGRGELVEVLASRGITATGIDPDPGMVAEAQGHGPRRRARRRPRAPARHARQRARRGDLACTSSSTSSSPVLVELLELAGGAPPARWRVRGRDPEPDVAHRARQLLHPRPDPRLAAAPVADDVPRASAPGSATSSCASTRRPRTTGSRRSTPARTPRRGSRELNVGIERLNDVLFGPQEYAVIAAYPAGLNRHEVCRAQLPERASAAGSVLSRIIRSRRKLSVSTYARVDIRVEVHQPVAPVKARIGNKDCR